MFEYDADSPASSDRRRCIESQARTSLWAREADSETDRMGWLCVKLTGWLRRTTPALVLPGLMLISCSEPVEPGAGVLATVARQPVTQAVFDAFVMQRTGHDASGLSPKQKALLLDDLLKLSAAASMVPRPGEQLADAQAELKRLELASKTAATTAGAFRMPSDLDLQAEYKRFVETRPSVEYHAAHILVPTQAQAKDIARRLASGEDFATLAAEFSVDGSASWGGDLGWLDPKILPAELVAAASALAPGTHSSHPLKTKYGWHVVRLIETRPSAAAPLEEVRTQLIVAIQQRRYREFLDSVVDRVKVVRIAVP